MKKKLAKVGPFGSDTGGKAFDHGAHSTVRQVVISITSKLIRSIEIEYDDNGISVWTSKLGNNRDKDAPTYVHTIKLDYPNEYLVSVGGRWESGFWHSTFVSSLIFVNNKNTTYGPYGDVKSDGKFFSIHKQGDMIVGFHGRASDEWAGIRALGAYLKPLDHHHSRSGTYRLPKVLDFVPELGNPSSPLHEQAKCTCLTKLKNKRDDDEDNKRLFVTIAGNQVMGNEGKEMGSFIVGNKLKYKTITHCYSISR